jgi:hypothetical protein
MLRPPRSSETYRTTPRQPAPPSWAGTLRWGQAGRGVAAFVAWPGPRIRRCRTTGPRSRSASVSTEEFPSPASVVDVAGDSAVAHQVRAGATNAVHGDHLPPPAVVSRWPCVSTSGTAGGASPGQFLHPSQPATGTLPQIVDGIRTQSAPWEVACPMPSPVPTRMPPCRRRNAHTHARALALIATGEVPVAMRISTTWNPAA